MQNNLNFSELERIAYISGDTVRAEIYAQLDETQLEIEIVSEQIQDLQETSLAEWERINGSANEYKAFFEECFQRLADHYPCPSITSDYDKSVIFEAIERGEAANAEGE